MPRTDIERFWSIHSVAGNYDFIFLENGSTVASGSGLTSTTTLVRDIDSGAPVIEVIGGKVTITLQIVVNSGQMDIQVRIKDNGHPIVRCEKITQSVVVDTTIICSYDGTVGGLVQGPPTYLEQLSKLDQWTKAQYIPR